MKTLVSPLMKEPGPEVWPYLNAENARWLMLGQRIVLRGETPDAIDPVEVVRQATWAVAHLALPGSAHVQCAITTLVMPHIRHPETHPPKPLPKRLRRHPEVLPADGRWQVEGMCGPRVARFLRCRAARHLHAMSGIAYYVDLRGRHCLWGHVWTEDKKGRVFDPSTGLQGVPEGACLIGTPARMTREGGTIGPVLRMPVMFD